MTDSRRRIPVIAGVAVLLVALVGAGLLWFSADERHEDAVRDLARAPAGCETTLEIADGGTYHLYLETAGRLGELPGGCVAAPGEFELPRGSEPQAEVELTAPDGTTIPVVASDGIAYDVGGFRGVEVGEVTVEQAGSYVLGVGPPEGGFAIAVGGDPDDGTDLLRGAAVGTIVVGLLVAGILFLVAARRPPAPTSARPVPPPSPHAPSPWPSGPPLRAPGPPSAGAGGPSAPPGGAEPARSPWAPPPPPPSG